MIGILIVLSFVLFLIIGGLISNIRYLGTDTVYFYNKYSNNLQEITDELIYKYLYAYTGYSYMEVGGDTVYYYAEDQKLLYSELINKGSPLIHGKITVIRISYFDIEHDIGSKCLKLDLYKESWLGDYFTVGFNMHENINVRCGEERMGERFRYGVYDSYLESLRQEK